MEQVLNNQLVDIKIILKVTPKLIVWTMQLEKRTATSTSKLMVIIFI
jgi:hypothetical protein